MSEVMVQTDAQLWMNHNKPQSATMKHTPRYYHLAYSVRSPAAPLAHALLDALHGRHDEIGGQIDHPETAHSHHRFAMRFAGRSKSTATTIADC
jgi:hypothetical protein